MELLKISMEGLPHFSGKLDIDFTARQRVSDDDRETLYHVFSNVYVNPVISFVGINASGKTTILKVLSFVLNMLNNEAINNISSSEILNDLRDGQGVRIISHFHHQQNVYKLETCIVKRISFMDGSEKLVISDESLWVKDVRKIKTKKSLYDFTDTDLKMKRNQKEQFLMDDVSIMIAENKASESNFYLLDMSALTNHNMFLLNFLGKFPEELLTFLDPSIEYLKGNSENKSEDFRLKFYGSEEIILNDPGSIEKYLSSGTIKGLNLFISATIMFLQGGYLIVDELENHFNGEIVATLVRFFMDHKVNKSGGTLVYSTHYAELLDEFERNDSIYIVRNRGGIEAENLSQILKRNDIKKSEAYSSGYLEGTVPSYEAYMGLKKIFSYAELGEE